MIRYILSAGLIGGLSACMAGPDSGTTGTGETLYKSAFQGEAFRPADAEIFTIGSSGFRTFALRPCGDTVCGARRATLQDFEGDVLVTGAYRGVTFRLAPGGVGAYRAGGDSVPVVWDFTD